MSATPTSKSKPDEKAELLSEKAMRLADRIAGLVERSLNLYEAHLVAAEANPPSADTPVEEMDQTPANPRASRTRTDSTPRVTTGGVAHLAQLKSLVRSMEALLRIARLARELEKVDAEKVDKSWMDPDALRRFLSEMVDEDFGDVRRDDAREADNFEANPTPSHSGTEFQNFPPPTFPKLNSPPWRGAG